VNFLDKFKKQSILLIQLKEKETMILDKDSIIQIIKSQIEVEKTNVKEALETERKMERDVAKLFLEIIRMDSQKHSNILSRTLKILENPTIKSRENFFYIYYAPIVVRKELEAHKKREKEMMSLIKKELKQTKREGLKNILNLILEDEKKHSKMLKSISDKLYKIEE
jgi:rubrerythrin